jgi:predicted ATPase
MSFRLLSVETLASDGVLSETTPLLNFSIEPRGVRYISFIDRETVSDNNQELSILIGNNGSGKSRLLGDIARAFLFLEGSAHVRRPFPLRKLVYLLDGDVYEVSAVDKRVMATINGRFAELAEFKLPHVISLTLTPFDKFPLPRHVFSTATDAPADSIYTYFGLRDRTNRASITALLYRSIEGLSEVSRSGSKRRNQVVGVFDFLGYEPGVHLAYRFRAGLSQFESLLSEDGEALTNLSPITHRRIVDALENKRITKKELDDAVKVFLSSRTRAREVELRLDFNASNDTNELFEATRLLRSVGLISLQSVVIDRKDGIRFDLKDASSGELSIVTAFLSLATAVEDASLILVDEPEISLHPAWQNRYVDLLLSTFEAYAGCHYVVATHSPLILSDSSITASKVIYLDASEGMGVRFLAGQSPDYLLVNAFRVPGRNNYYLKQELVAALRLVADGEIESEDFSSRMKILTPLLETLDKKDPVFEVISQLANLKIGTERKR